MTTPELIAKLITEDPDIINEISSNFPRKSKKASKPWINGFLISFTQLDGHKEHICVHTSTKVVADTIKTWFLNQCEEQNIKIKPESIRVNFINTCAYPKHKGFRNKIRGLGAWH